jgi:tetratricopeptide (TPR) repeat protein
VLAAGLVSSAAANASTAAWCETRSPEFQLISDLPETEQRQLISKLARFEQLAEPFLPGDPLARRGALKLVVFQRRQDFLDLTGKRKFAGYMQPALQTNRLLIGPIRGDLSETTLHEYAHYLLRNRTGVSLPLWFDEGLATLLGATVLTEDAAVIGDIPVDRLEKRISRHSEPGSPQQRLSRTLEATSLESWHRDRVNEFYDIAWLLAHYLYFDIYREDVSRGEIPSSILARYLNARDQSLPDHLGMRSSQLLRSLEKHLKRWKTPDPVPAPAAALPELSFRCLDTLERDLSLALAVHRQSPDEARSLLSPYLDPHSAASVSLEQRVALNVAMARVELASDDAEVAERWVTEALSLNPQHAEARVLAADLSVRNCLFDRSEGCRQKWQTASSRYRSALRQDPTRYDGILGVGLAELHSGRAGDAVNYLKVAYARAPWAAVINYYLGESYRLMGDSRATIYLENARNWAVEDIWRLLAEESLRLIAEPAQAIPSER